MTIQVISLAKYQIFILYSYQSINICLKLVMVVGRQLIGVAEWVCVILCASE